jgi:hypothetical protein
VIGRLRPIRRASWKDCNSLSFENLRVMIQAWNIEWSKISARDVRTSTSREKIYCKSTTGPIDLLRPSMPLFSLRLWAGCGRLLFEEVDEGKRKSKREGRGHISRHFSSAPRILQLRSLALGSPVSSQRLKPGFATRFLPEPILPGFWVRVRVF